KKLAARGCGPRRGDVHDGKTRARCVAPEAPLAAKTLPAQGSAGMQSAAALGSCAAGTFFVFQRLKNRSASVMAAQRDGVRFVTSIKAEGCAARTAGAASRRPINLRLSLG